MSGCNPCIPSVGEHDKLRVRDFLKDVSADLPSGKAGDRFSRLLNKDNCSKMHHYFVLAGRPATWLVRDTHMPPVQYIYVQVCHGPRGHRANPQPLDHCQDYRGGSSWPI